MIKCPRCGYEQPKNEGERYRKAVEDRLAEYGYSKGMSPQKYQAVVAVKKVIAIRTGISYKAGGGMSKEYADKGIEMLDKILPPKDNGLL